MIIILVIALLVVLIAAEVPIAFSLAASGFVGLLLLSGSDVAGSAVASISYASIAKFTLVIIPLFIAMGVMARHARIAEDAFAVASRTLRRIPGSLALAAILACAVFAAVSGSSVAAVVAIGRPAIGEMIRHGYSRPVALGVVGAAGTLGVLIPPSIVLVIYGVLTGVSIGALLLAGIIPGMLSALLYGFAVVLRARHRPELFGGLMPSGDPPDALAMVASGSNHSHRSIQAEGEPTAVARTTRKTGRHRVGVLRAGVLFTIVLGGIYTGVFTAIESAAVGAVTVFVMMVWERLREGWRSTWTSIREAVVESVEMNAMVAALLVGSAIFSSFMVSSGMPLRINRWLSELPLPPLMIVALVLLAFIPLGMFLDPISSMLIAVPLVYPVVEGFGYSGVWFGILVVKCIEIGLITPPLGINAFVIAGVDKDATVEEAFRGVLWFLPVDLVTISLLFAFPWLTTALGGGL
jgi:C4-dicarboxylate transporter, DctM subunit